jgi:AraC-like DNA-binding protein
MAQSISSNSIRTGGPGHARGPVGFPGDVRVGTILQVPTLLDEFGLDCKSVLAAAGAAPDSFADPNARMPFDVLGRLLATCVERSNCPHFGLLVGRRFEPPSLGELNSLMQNCRTVREALELGTSHLQVADRGAMAFLLDIGEDRSALGYALFAGIIPGAAYIVDGALAMLCHVLRGLCGPSWRPLLVRLSRKRPMDLRPYRAAFGDDLEFDADLSMIVFESRWNDRPIAGAKNEVFLAAARTIELSEAANPIPYSRQVRRLIHALLFTNSVSTVQIARLLNVAPRTLRRRLAQDDATVRNLVGDVRRELSFHLLRDTRLKLSEIAAALRYADAAVYSRAFRSWVNMSPRQWRAIGARESRDPARAPAD